MNHQSPEQEGKEYCDKCGKELIPARAFSDGERTFVGYHPHECEPQRFWNEELGHWEPYAKVEPSPSPVAGRTYTEEERDKFALDFIEWAQKYTGKILAFALHSLLLTYKDLNRKP